MEIFEVVKKKVVTGYADLIGVVIEIADKNYVITDFEKGLNWGGTVNVYVGRASLNTSIGSFESSIRGAGGALIVEETDKPKTIFVD